MKTKLAAGAAAGVAIVALASVGAAAAIPAAKDWYEGRHDQSSQYTTGAEAKAGRASVPRWLPDDAREIRYAMKTTGGDRLLKATLPTGKLPAECTALPSSTRAKEPNLSASWFPGKETGLAQARCGLYYAYTDGNTLYAWQDNDDWINDNKSS
ncbi:hypothetical protein [Streptomyces sp. UNOB3_S3]|uniref:hypothetical protein n=1 Tax=Streptomyces sp. UNOB3_S3 TaxID=2871682 RepID=UPI001E3C862E|nr:hypothetical protein [Streptomyces sp. UNOB3_S3]